MQHFFLFFFKKNLHTARVWRKNNETELLDFNKAVQVGQATELGNELVFLVCAAMAAETIRQREAELVGDAMRERKAFVTLHIQHLNGEAVQGLTNVVGESWVVLVDVLHLWKSFLMMMSNARSKTTPATTDTIQTVPLS